jgi:hypothetical protein
VAVDQHVESGVGDFVPVLNKPLEQLAFGQARGCFRVKQGIEQDRQFGDVVVDRALKAIGVGRVEALVLMGEAVGGTDHLAVGGTNHRAARALLRELDLHVNRPFGKPA